MPGCENDDQVAVLGGDGRTVGRCRNKERRGWLDSHPLEAREREMVMVMGDVLAARFEMVG